MALVTREGDPAQLLAEGKDGKFATKMQNQREQRNEENETRTTRATAGHKLTRHGCVIRSSAQVESQRSKENFHVHESPPILGSYSQEKPGAKLRLIADN